MEIDTVLAAVALPADPAIIDLIVAAFISAGAASHALAAAAPTSRRLLELGYETIRWLQFRRRCHTGVLDEWIVESAMMREVYSRLPEPTRQAALKHWANRVDEETIASPK